MKLRTKLVLDYYAGGVLHFLLRPFVFLVGKLLGRSHDLSQVREFTFFKFLGGGSLVIAYPMLLALKRANGGCRLRLVTLRQTQLFAECLGVFDEILVIDDRSLVAVAVSGVQTLQRVFGTDALVDLELHSRLSVVFGVFTGAKNRIGFYSGSSFWRRNLASHLLYFNPSAPIHFFYDQIATLFGQPVPNLAASRHSFRAALGVPAERAPQPGLRLAIAPGCSDLSPERMLSVAQWRTVLTRHLPQWAGAEVTLVGGPADRAYCAELKVALEEALGPAGCTVHNAAGDLPLAGSVALLDQMNLLLCIDSGLLHFARLLGVPTESFWGPTSPLALLREADPATDRVHYRPIPCSPCVHHAGVAPCRGHNLCIQGLFQEPGSAPINAPWLA